MTVRLRVDWPACKARGLCFEPLPETVRLDDWAYPVVGTVPPALVESAREAVCACPTLALRLGQRPSRLRDVSEAG
jgi:ferredoxin